MTKFAIMTFIAIALNACGQPETDDAVFNAKVSAEVDRRLAEMSDQIGAEAEASGALHMRPIDPAAPAGPVVTKGAKSSSENAVAAVDLCWQDYCPCDPPQGGADAGLCRMLRAGLEVDEGMLAAGAMGRDARQQLDDWEAKHGGY